MKYLVLCLSIFAHSVFAEETRDLPDFNEVSAAAGVKVILVKSSQTKANVEVENCDPEDVITEVRGSKLVVKFDDKISWTRSNRNRKATVTVYYKAVSAVGVSSGAMIHSDEVIEAGNLELDGSSGGMMEFEVNSRALNVDISSGGIIKINGKTESLDVDVSSGGVFKAYDLRSDSATADASSGGVASFSVAKTLDADASSGGSIRYRGNPDKVHSNASSSGSIRADKSE